MPASAAGAVTHAVCILYHLQQQYQDKQWAIFKTVTSLISFLGAATAIGVSGSGVEEPSDSYDSFSEVVYAVEALQGIVSNVNAMNTVPPEVKDIAVLATAGLTQSQTIDAWNQVGVPHRHCQGTLLLMNAGICATPRHGNHFRALWWRAHVPCHIIRRVVL